MKMKKISVIIIIIGLLVASSPFWGEIYTHFMQQKLISDWQNGTQPEVIEQTGDSEQFYNELQDIFMINARNGTVPDTFATGGTSSPAATSSPTVTASPKKTTQPFKPQIVLGTIKISKIKVNIPVVEGVAAENLRVGAGHIPGTAGIGEIGNCALAGHRNYTFGRYFNRLDEMGEGDEIVITTKKGTFTYTVYEKLVVKPTDVSVLKRNGSDRILTLITCTPIYVASHRLIIHARMQPEEAPEEVPEEEPKEALEEDK